MAVTHRFQGPAALLRIGISRHYSVFRQLYRCLCVSLCILALPVFAAPSCNDLSSFTWLTGSWYSINGATSGEESKSVRESWQRVSVSTFEGSTVSTRTAPGGVVSEYAEHLRLVQMLDGVFYLAKVPENQMPVPFKAVSCHTHDVRFENPSHDFPQRLHYRLNGTTLSIRVENLEGKGFELNLERETPER